MSEQSDRQSRPTVQTTGHAWDGDLQEYNNPLPRWWLYTFYASIAFAVIYWLFYPAWPLGFLDEGYTRGAMTITYEADNETREVPWNTRAKLMHEMQTSDAAVRQRQYLEEVSEASYEEILADADQMAFARSIGKQLFGNNCAACHGTGGAGVVGLFPNLADDGWLWGGGVHQIEETLIYGRYGYMPGYEQTLDEGQLAAVSTYVLSLSGHEVDAEQAAAGETIFQGDIGGCHQCHTASGKGIPSIGSANLTDAIWTVAEVNRAETLEAKQAEVEHTIRHGIQRLMPAQTGRLSPEEIKMLTVYVHELGGGQ